jgi:hypothetical protein
MPASGFCAGLCPYLYRIATLVQLKDCHDTEHSVEVYAESLYEAVLRGLGRFATRLP